MTIIDDKSRGGSVYQDAQPGFVKTGHTTDKKKIKHLMRTDFEKLRARQRLSAATDKLWTRGDRYACVMGADGGIVGVLDLLSAVDSVRSTAGAGANIADPRVEDLMQSVLWESSPESDADDILMSMQATGLRCAPVMEGPNLVGLITVEDLRDGLKPRTLENQNEASVH